MKEQKLVIDKMDFEPRHIFECGQCFRWHRQEDDSYTGVFGNNVLNVKKQAKSVVFEGICEDESAKKQTHVLLSLFPMQEKPMGLGLRGNEIIALC